VSGEQSSGRTLEILRLQKSSGHIFTIYASKNEAVFHEVEIHSLSFVPSMLTKNVLGAFSQFMRQKTRNFAVNETHFGSSLLARFAKIFSGAFLRFMRPKTKLFAVKFRQI